MSRGTGQPDFVRHLLEHGPSTADEFDGDSSIKADTRERWGIRRVNIRAGTGNHGPGRSKVVYYHLSHDLRDVVRKYLEVNDTLLDETTATLTELFGSHSKDLKRAWREIADEYDTPTRNLPRNPGRGGERGGECPMCGEEIDNHLPDHLPDCEGGEAA